MEMTMLAAAVGTAVALARALATARPAWLLDRFARRVDLPLDGAESAGVAPRLVRRERAGAAGGLVGVWAVVGGLLVSADEVRGPYGPFLVALGYFAGHALAQGAVAWRESARRSPDQRPRIARAYAPGQTDYVPRHERYGAWVVSALTAGGAAVALVLAPADVPRPLLVAGLVLPPAFVLAHELLARRLLDRPQVAADLTELAWDDVLRARTLRDMVTVPLYVGFVLLIAIPSLVGDALEGGWPANPAVGVVSGLVIVLLLGGLVMAAVSTGLQPHRHVRRRLWPHPAPERLPGGPR